MLTDPADWSLEQIRAKQQEFLDTLTAEVRRNPTAAVDLRFIAQSVGIEPMLACEFIHYWINMGRLDAAWSIVAQRLQDELTPTPLRPPTSRVGDGSDEARVRRRYDETQRRAYRDLWRYVMEIGDRRSPAQLSLPTRREGVVYHRTEKELGYDAIRDVDRLSAFLLHDHYESIRRYFTAFVNYHQYRLEKYSDEGEQDPGGWNDQDKLLYAQVFTTGRSGIERIFRDALAAEEAADPTNLFVGSLTMGDTYSSSGQTGAMGPRANASNMTFQQLVGEGQAAPDVKQLVEELARLRSAMQAQATEPEHELDIGAIAAAEAAARGGDGNKAVQYLKKAGTWALDVATKIGVNVVSASIKGSL